MQVRCGKAGHPKEVLSVEAEPIPAELEWGQVLVNVRAAPIGPADLYTVATGGLYGQDHSEPPFVGGHDGVGVIVKVSSEGLGCCRQPQLYMQMPRAPPASLCRWARGSSLWLRTNGSSR